MGLDVSHNAFRGAYSAFNRLRQEIAKAAGCSYPPHHDPSMDDKFWYAPDDGWVARNPGLTIFFSHSDCDGHIAPSDCKDVADELEALLPQLGDGGSGHIESQGGFRKVTEKFIAGCRAAYSRVEALEFY